MFNMNAKDLKYLDNNRMINADCKRFKLETHFEQTRKLFYGDIKSATFQKRDN